MNLLTTSSHVAILGAGLMGRLLAFALARQGLRVSIFDAAGPGAENAAARVAAAMLAPLAESAVTEPSVVQMGRYALGRWTALVADLAAYAPPVFLQQAGTLIVWHRQDAAEAARLGQQLFTNQRNMPELPAPQRLDGAGIAALEPALGQRFNQGLYLPEEGQLDNRALLAALGQALVVLGVDIHWNSPRTPEQLKGNADWIFDCRGLGARPQWNALRGVRGEVVRVHAPDVHLTRPTRLVHPRYPLYIAPKPEGVFVIGATEIESDDLSPASVRSTLELLSAAYAVHSGFAEARILEIATQCRPALPDNLPALRQLDRHTLQINGLYRHGFMIAPAMLDAAIELVQTGHSPLAESFGLLNTAQPSTT
jgi:glycine oxidase